MEENSMDAVIRRDKKERKKLKVKTEVFSETAERLAPIVGYFPSGYDPTSAAADPDVKVFRNRTKPSRLELIVRPGDSNVEFIGKSYVGEAAVPQLSTYALGVLDKETKTLKIVPIAANKVSDPSSDYTPIKDDALFTRSPTRTLHPTLSVSLIITVLGL